MSHRFHLQHTRSPLGERGRETPGTDKSQVKLTQCCNEGGVDEKMIEGLESAFSSWGDNRTSSNKTGTNNINFEGNKSK